MEDMESEGGSESGGREEVADDAGGEADGGGNGEMETDGVGGNGGGGMMGIREGGSDWVESGGEVVMGVGAREVVGGVGGRGLVPAAR